MLAEVCGGFRAIRGSGASRHVVQSRIALTDRRLVVAPTVAIASITAAGASSDTNVRAPGTSISAAFGNSARRRPMRG